MMRLLFVADGRSPIALNWISYFCETGYEVHLVSTFDCAPELPLASLRFLPVAMSEFRQGNSDSPRGLSVRSLSSKLVPVGLRTSLRHWLAPLTLLRASRRLAEMITAIQPDLVHAMRIPYEGMAAAMAAAMAVSEGSGSPLLISTWGNDFTLHAPSTPWMRSLTRKTLHRADALHADCQRDIRLASRWGFSSSKLSVVLPGSGGVRLDLFHPPAVRAGGGEDGGLKVINPRGLRSYVRNDTFFKAVPLIIKQDPRFRFICTGMKGEPEAERWLEKLVIGDWVELLPHQSHTAMAELFRQAQIAISPSEHDGTPNTLLEAMASGCFPVAGDIESLREWIIPDVNGLLFDPADPSALAAAVLKASREPALQESAGIYNARLVSERAEYRGVMRQAETFYKSLVSARQPSL